jgi:DNA repair exonuclease SbcCD ATPase subunit
VTDAWRSIKIRQFEHVIAGPTTSLLRVSGKPRRRHGALQRPTLLADDGLHVQRFAAIPSPPDPRGVLRAAYSVPTELMKRDSVFSLELSDGWVIALPAPTPGAGRLIPGPSSRQEADSAEAAAAHLGRDAKAEPKPHTAHERRSATIDQLAELSSALAEAEQAGGEHEAGRTAAEAELQLSRQELGAVERRLAELKAEAGEAAQRLSAAQAQATEAGELAALATADADARALTAHDLSESLERRNVELDKSLHELQEGVDSLERDLAGAVAARGELEGELAALRNTRARSERELEQAHDAVRMMTFERDELSRQVAAFDGVAVKARERATQADAANERSTAALEELQTWRAELERRLTATTTELGAAKTARQEDEHELKRLGGELAEAEAKFELARAQIEILNGKLAAHGTPDGAPDASPPPVTDQSAELERMAAELQRTAAELAALRATPAAPPPTAAAQTDRELLDRVQMLESEREEIARRAVQLAALLAPVERLGELVQGLTQARTEAENLQAAVAVELRPSGGAAGAGAGGLEPDDANGALAGARAEIHTLRGQLEEARASAAEAQVELIGHAAEAEARQQAQRELTDASGHGRRSGR